MKKNFLITTGGSGGHVTPAKILSEHFSEEANIIFSTDKRGLRYLEKNMSQFYVINTPKLNNIFLLPINLIKIVVLTIESFFLLKKKEINKIFSTGGYMSLPIVLAAKILRLEIYLIEPNQVLGRANKFFLKFCKKIFCYSEHIKNFPQNYKKKIIVINPLVSEKIYKMRDSKEIKDKFTLLIVGGSQGANIFDKNLKNIVVNISKDNSIKIIHQTSEKKTPFLSEFYLKNNIENKIFSFERNFANIIKEADLCITRSGASTLAELSVMNIPFIAVPLPTSKDNHQLENANFYKKNDCCWVIEQNYFEEKIEDFLKEIFNDKSNFIRKKENLKRINYQNTWINVNQKILRIINEN
jgi:UDP-N-acetylglucosamine--N-acetylmuramyl-(pentapeptide) pyrophosphoryl-undecaprenol N-acetylglucosamine transferase